VLLRHDRNLIFIFSLLFFILNIYSAPSGTQDQKFRGKVYGPGLLTRGCKKAWHMLGFY